MRQAVDPAMALKSAEYPRLVPEPARGPSKAIPGASPRRSPSRTTVARDTDPEALIGLLRAQMRQSVNAGASAEAQEFARRLRMRIDAHTAGREGLTDAKLAALLLETGTVEAFCQRHIHALADYSRALRLATSFPALRDAIALRAALINAAYGRLHEAARLLGSVAEPLPSTPEGEATALLTRTLIAVERVDGEAAELLDRLTDVDCGSFWPFEVLARARWQLTQGFYAAALNLVAFAEAEHVVSPSMIAESVIAATRSAALTHLGHPGAALEVIGAVAVETPELRLMRGRARFQLGDDVAAEEQIDAVVRDEAAGPIVSAEAVLLKLWIAERRQDDAVTWFASLANRAVTAENLVRTLSSVPVRISSAVCPGSFSRIDIREPRSASGLRNSQMMVLRELQIGGSLIEIAERLQLSVNTVRTHSKAIYKRLDVHTREEAVSLARATGLLS